MVNFTLSEREQNVVKEARAFANEALTKGALACKSVKNRPQRERFEATLEAYQTAVKTGFMKYALPENMGGKFNSCIEAAIQWEELCAVDPSIGLSIMAQSLGLGPIVHGANEEQRARFLRSFLQSDGSVVADLPVASLAFTEVGGAANWLTPNGCKTTIIREGDEWVINGEKIWPNISAGFDGKGAALCTVVGRTSLTEDPLECTALVVITREDIERNPEGAFQMIREPESLGLRNMSGPHIKWTNLRVPLSNMIKQPGMEAIKLVEKAFTESAAMVSATSIGIMRRAFEIALKFAQTDSRNGPHPIIGYQSVADQLVDSKAKIEASRMLVWKACDDLDKGLGSERALLSKIFVADTCMDVVVACARVIGTIALDTDSFPFDELISDACCMSIFDGGNIGIRRRQVQAIFSDPSYTAEISRGF